MNKTIVTIGEILWDILPTGKKPGGSSMNVALNLQKQGIASKLISAIGDDDDGKELLSFLKHNQFPTQFIQQSELPTSTVQVTLDAQHQASYTIVEPVAWDDLKLTDELITEVKNADAFVYCSLTCRNEKSMATISELLKVARFNVFDINLREPFYTIETLTILLAQANLLKINEHELAYLKKTLGLTEGSDELALVELHQKYNLSIICLTLGDKGAITLHENEFFHHNGYPAKVVDTVGAGDSFLATFIASYLKGYHMDEILDKSCRVGAYVAEQEGANPEYDTALKILTR